jgi:hypothetical protein
MLRLLDFLKIDVYVNRLILCGAAAAAAEFLTIHTVLAGTKRTIVLFYAHNGSGVHGNRPNLGLPPIQ